jgi:hypothetical protein
MMKRRFIVAVTLAIIGSAIAIPTSVMAKESPAVSEQPEVMQVTSYGICDEVMCTDWVCEQAWEQCDCSYLWVCQWDDGRARCGRDCYDVQTGEFCSHDTRVCFFPYTWPTCPDPDEGVTCAWHQPWNPCPGQHAPITCYGWRCSMCGE